MIASVPRLKLAEELDHMVRIAESSSSIPILSHVRIEVGDDRMKLSATDLDISLVSSIEVDGSAAGSIATPAKKLQQIVKSITSDTVQIAAEENQLSVSGGSARFKVRCLPASDFPEIYTAAGTEHLVPSGLLSRLIAAASYAISNEGSRYQLEAALLSLTPGSAAMASTDGHRLVAVTLASAELGAEVSALLSPKSLAELARLDKGDAPIKLSFHAHRVGVIAGDRELVARIPEGSFPDWRRVVDKYVVATAEGDRLALIAAAKRVAIMTGERSRGIRFKFGDGALLLSAANPDLGEATDRVLADAKADGAIEIGMQPAYLCEALGAMTSERVRLSIAGKEGRQIQLAPAPSVPGEEVVALIMEMRL